MKEKNLIPCGQESIYSVMKPYFTKHCSPSSGEQCKADASRHRCEPWQSNSRGFSKFFVQCTVRYVHVCMHVYTCICLHTCVCAACICDRASKTRPSGNKIHHITKCTYHEFCVQYLLSVSCNMLPMKLFMNGKKFTFTASADH